jgi:ribosomal protein L40E
MHITLFLQGERMRGDIVALGIILMIIGVALLSFLGVTIANITSGTIGVYFPQIIGAALAFIGFLTFIAGLAASPTTERKTTVIRQSPAQTLRSKLPVPQKQQVQTRVVAICPKCKNRIAVNSNFCPKCGEDLRPKKAS